MRGKSCGILLFMILVIHVYYTSAIPYAKPGNERVSVKEQENRQAFGTSVSEDLAGRRMTKQAAASESGIAPGGFSPGFSSGFKDIPETDRAVQGYVLEAGLSPPSEKQRRKE